MVSSAIWDKSALVNLSYWPGRLVYWHLRRTLNRTVGSEDSQEFEKTRFVPAINLANFLKTNIYSEIWSPGLIEKGPKGRFFAPDKLEINNCKGKGKEEKYKEGGGRKEEKKKKQWLYSWFLLATLATSWRKTEVYSAVTLSKIQLDISTTLLGHSHLKKKILTKLYKNKFYYNFQILMDDLHLFHTSMC